MKRSVVVVYFLVRGVLVVSKMFSSCIYVSFVNKYIENGWMSFFYFTESREATSPSKSKPPINNEVADSKQSASNDDSLPLGTHEASSSSLIPDRGDGPILKKEDSIQRRTLLRRRKLVMKRWKTTQWSH